MNWVGTKTLMGREVDRFLEAPLQTIAQPLVSTSMFYVVFGLVWGGVRGDDSYARFIAPGMVYLSVANTAFVNCSTSLLFSKGMRTLEDLLMAPLTTGELLVAFIFGGLARSLLVGALTFGVVMLFDPFVPAFPLQLVACIVLIAWLFAAMGALIGIWAEKFEQVNFFPVFLIMPLTFLGGVFYRLENLGRTARALSEFNPMVHLIRLVRYSVLGQGEPAGALTLVSLCAAVVAVTIALYTALRTGWKLKS